MSDAFILRNTPQVTAHLAAQAARLGWYWGLGRLVARQTRSAGLTSDYKPKRPIPKFQELLADLGTLMLQDAKAVADGRYPQMPEAGDTLADYLARVRAMIADLPSALERRASEETGSAKSVAVADSALLPDYYAQDFHFQTGGYLSADSARLYDVQVETLFMGAAGAMRRRALGAVADAIHGHDQRRLQLLDIACGTGRFLRQVRLAFPRIGLAGLDLSRAYLDEAQLGFAKLKPATWYQANAEQIPLPDASQDIVTSIFLFHELPPDIRRDVAAEMARVLKPGARLIFMDSLQMGDKPGWDGLLEAFPVRFHEPYYRHYAIDDLDALFNGVGLVAEATETPFMAKLMVRRKL